MVQTMTITKREQLNIFLVPSMGR